MASKTWAKLGYAIYKTFEIIYILNIKIQFSPRRKQLSKTNFCAQHFEPNYCKIPKSKQSSLTRISCSSWTQQEVAFTLVVLYRRSELSEQLQK